MAVQYSSIAPDAIEVREIADISTYLTASLAAAVTGAGGSLTTPQAVTAAATVLAGVTIALAQARGLNYNIYNPAN